MAAAAQLLDRFVKFIIDPLILLVFAAGFFMFVWGLVQFLINLEDVSAHEEGIEHMKWGIVGMLVMVSVYGIIALLDNTFNLGAFNGQTPDMSALQNIPPFQGFTNGK